MNWRDVVGFIFAIWFLFWAYSEMTEPSMYEQVYGDELNDYHLEESKKLLEDEIG